MDDTIHVLQVALEPRQGPGGEHGLTGGTEFEGVALRCLLTSPDLEWMVRCRKRPSPHSLLKLQPELGVDIGKNPGLLLQTIGSLRRLRRGIKMN